MKFQAKHALAYPKSLGGLVVIALAGLAGTIGIYRFADNAENNRIKDDFVRRAAVRHALISESLHRYEECVYNLRGLFSSSDEVTPAEFANVAEDIYSRHPGLQAIQWIPVVPDSRRIEVEAWARREIAPDFRFTERSTDGGIVTAARRPFYRPILYTYPLSGNEAALGYDIQTRPTQDDMDRALRTRDLVLTRKIPLVQRIAGSENYGAIMVVPIYRGAKDRGDLLGFAQIVFRLEDILSSSWTRYPGSVLDTLFLDRTDPQDPDPFLFGRRPAESKASGITPRSLEDLSSELRYQDSVHIGGRVWSCHYSPTAGWLESQRSFIPLLFLLGGLTFTSVICAYYNSTRRRSGLVARQVEERTAELRDTQRLLEDDIRQRQTVEAELRDSRRLLDGILSQMPGIAYRCAHDTQPPAALFISQGSLDILGYAPEEITSGRVCHADLIVADDRPLRERAIEKALAEKTAFECAYRVVARDGSVKWLFDRGQAVYSPEGALLFVEGLAIDVTGPKQAEEQRDALERKLLEAQKFESLGVLAGGIAHDFNNLLTTIVGNASIARLDLPVDSPLQTNLDQIEKGALRASELCQQMLAYAGKGRFVVQTLGLDQLVRETTPLLEHSISKNARLSFRFQPGLPAVDIDATQIRQIVMNLVVNASDALGDKPGEIALETFPMGVDDPRLARAVLAPPTGADLFVCLAVRDTGVGMDEATVHKIFDPFFTTKFAGRGLGLAAVLGIVRGHQGSLLVESVPGAGSTFTLLLPASRRTASPAGSAGDAARISAPRRNRLALLIDDEESVRAVAEQMFRTLGLEAITAEDGEEGLRLFQARRAELSIVLLDLTMPRMSGHDVLRALRRQAPDFPVVLMSGYNETEVPGLAADARVAFLQKPFTLHQLHVAVGKMLA